MRHILPQRPIQMRYRLGTAPELHLTAEIVSTDFARLTSLAVDPDFHRDLVSDFEVACYGQVGAKSRDRSTGFVSQCQGGSDGEARVAAFEKVVYCSNVSEVTASFCKLSHARRANLYDRRGVGSNRLTIGAAETCIGYLDLYLSRSGNRDRHVVLARRSARHSS